MLEHKENEINEQISYLESIVYELENSNSMEELTEIYDEISNNVLIKILVYKSKKIAIKKKKS